MPAAIPASSRHGAAAAAPSCSTARYARRSEAQMQLYSPLSTTPKRKVFRAPALARIDGMRIGVLENGKLNAEEMLNEVAALFVQRNGCTVRTLASKKNASAPAPSNTLMQVAQEVDFLITGLGD